jgi:hypothetical protein
VDDMMAGHVPAVWISDRYSAQQKHGERHQTCLAVITHPYLLSGEFAVWSWLKPGC